MTYYLMSLSLNFYKDTYFYCRDILKISDFDRELNSYSMETMKQEKTKLTYFRPGIFSAPSLKQNLLTALE